VGCVVDYPVSIVTGSPGSGKTYWVVMRLVKEILPVFTNVRVITNVPIFWWEDPDRVEVMEFESGWIPPGDTLEERLEWGRDAIIIVDECQEVLSKESSQDWKEILGKARKRNTRWVLMTQSKENIYKWVDDLAGEWVESLNCGSLRDKVLGFRIEDLQELWAKLTGKWVESFEKTTYVKKQRRWKSTSVYREFFNPAIGDRYDTKQGADVDEQGGAVVERAYKRLSWLKLLYVVGVRNAQVIPLAVLRIGLPVGMLAASCVWMAGGVGWLFWSKPETPVLTVAERAVKAKLESVPVVVPAAAVAPAADHVKAAKVIPKRVVVWLLVVALFVGCVAAEKRVDVPIPEHVVRKSVTPDPKTAVYGDGHSLDEVLSGVGIESHTDAVVSGPLVGREVLDVARSHGHSLIGDKLVPARRRATPVPSELRAGIKGTIDVGGFPVKAVDDAEFDHWLDLSAVVHEAYCTEVLIVSVTSSRSTQLSAIANGAGTLAVTYPSNSALPWWTGTSIAAGVSLAANGAVVNGRVVAHPVLFGSPGASSNVHVGQKIPVMLAQSSVSNQTTTTIGTSLTYVQTGTTVTLRCLRVSETQARLTGNVTLSDQVSTINNVPVTDDRSLSVDHLVSLDQWQLVGRLDSATAKTSSGIRWLSLGGLWAYSDDTFVVLAKTMQVHRDSRLHVPSETAAGVPEVVVKELEEKLQKAGGPEWKSDVEQVKPSQSPALVQSPVAGVQPNAFGAVGGAGASPAVGVPGAVTGGTGSVGVPGPGVGGGVNGQGSVSGNGVPYPQ